MKVSKNVVVGILVVVAVGVVFYNVVLPLVRRPSVTPRAPITAPIVAPVRGPTAIQGAVESASAAPLTPPIGGSTSSSSIGLATNQLAPASERDLAIAQQNPQRWMESPRRDPFRMRTEGTNRPISFRTAMELLTLNAIFRRSGNTLAVINNRVLSEGGRIMDYQIKSIGIERVLVDGPNGREEIVFDNGGLLRAVSQRLGGIPEGSVIEPDVRYNWPYRIVNGVTNDVHSSAGWRSLSGVNLEKIPAGNRIWVNPGAEETEPGPTSEIVVVKNFPVDLLDGARLEPFRAKLVGHESYAARTGNRQTETVKAYDFGVPSDPPTKSVDQLTVQRSAFLQQNAEARARRAKIDKAAAESGNASAQFVLGHRYLDGEGVPQDTNEARRWFEKSAAQGNPDAVAALAALSDSSNPK